MTQSVQTSCHGPVPVETEGMPLVVLVGQPNVGKSVLFHHLTGIYVTVSNYPGTTVEVTRGKGRVAGDEFAVMDTPGMYGFLPITEEERIARRLLLEERPSLVIHVVDAKNLERMLPMTLQFIEAGLPLMLVLNLMDEAERAGVQVDEDVLQRALGIPVVKTALARGQGVEAVRAAVAAALRGDTSPRQSPAVIRYPDQIEQAIDRLSRALQGEHSLSRRMIALLLLQGDEEIVAMVRQREPNPEDVLRAVEEGRQAFADTPMLEIALALRLRAAELAGQAISVHAPAKPGISARLSEAMMNPLTGILLLVFTLFLVYEFVGVLGAQVLVDFLENGVFAAYVNPWVDALLGRVVPWPWLRSLFGGEFGIITLGIRYAVAIVLPVVATFFLAFSLIEDSGYLPRLAMLIDRVFKKIGLSGRAVIPMVLGFGCDTMATLVARTLETRRERVISTLLLALAIPCSAQLGVMLGLLGGDVRLLAVWTAVLSAVFLLVGYLAAQVTPGERPVFYMELPPLRLPTVGNVLSKTAARMEWYLREVLPLFVLASVLIWVGQLTGLFDLALALIRPVMHWLGLPDQAATAFLFGFFRRDYGAAGLYDLQATLSARQLLVATVTMTLFVPCIAQVAVMFKERGWKVAVGILVFVVPFALLVGGGLNRVLLWLGMM
ncbi:MAG: ferrous iron transport protein B [Anaerolineae bacterium]|nr:MAG: ferrous iron transport protein B [Anaerolineae bacterium]